MRMTQQLQNSSNLSISKHYQNLKREKDLEEKDIQKKFAYPKPRFKIKTLSNANPKMPIHEKLVVLGRSQSQNMFPLKVNVNRDIPKSQEQSKSN